MKRLRSLAMSLLGVALLSSCSLLSPGPDVVHDDDLQQADARMEQIAVAINDDDVAAVKSMFSPRALEQAGFDARLDYLLSFFPNGGLSWERSSVGSEEGSTNGHKTEFLDALYKVSADGHDYWLLFKDFTVNETIDWCITSGAQPKVKRWVEVFPASNST